MEATLLKTTMPSFPTIHLRMPSMAQSTGVKFALEKALPPVTTLITHDTAVSISMLLDSEAPTTVMVTSTMSSEKVSTALFTSISTSTSTSISADSETETERLIPTTTGTATVTTNASSAAEDTPALGATLDTTSLSSSTDPSSPADSDSSDTATFIAKAPSSSPISPASSSDAAPLSGDNNEPQSHRLSTTFLATTALICGFLATMIFILLFRRLCAAKKQARQPRQLSTRRFSRAHPDLPWNADVENGRHGVEGGGIYPIEFMYIRRQRHTEVQWLSRRGGFERLPEPESEQEQGPLPPVPSSQNDEGDRDGEDKVREPPPAYSADGERDQAPGYEESGGGRRGDAR